VEILASPPGSRTHEEIIMYFTIRNPDPCLVLSMEESGEFIRAASKVLRHGLTDKYKAQLIEEAGDVMACLYLLETHNMFTIEEVTDRAKEKLDKLESYEESS
jgi:NTP pyrophosphatase (non-canonical NTP hydrolase)